MDIRRKGSESILPDRLSRSSIFEDGKPSQNQDHYNKYVTIL